MTDLSHAPAHQDNLLGICAALGEDFGFNPLWLRIGFAVSLLFALEWVVAAYLGLGVVVLASRLLFPKRSRRSAEVTTLPVREAPDAAVADFAKAA